MYINKNALNTPFHAFVICFDESKTKLVKQPLYNPIAKPYLDLMVLFTEWTFIYMYYSTVYGAVPSSLYFPAM